MRHFAITLTLSALAAPGFSQTTSPIPGTVTAEATEVVRVKPDQAKVYVTATSRNADASVATDEAEDVAKRFADGVQRLRVKGLKSSADPAKVAKLTDDRLALRGGFGAGGAATEIVASQQLVFTITDSDPKSLIESVEKVQREAVKEGLTGAVPDGSALSTRYSTEMVRAAYLKQDGMEDQLAAALGKATKKASARAEAIATGLGMKLGAVVAAEELPGGSDPAALLSPLTLSSRTTNVNPSAELVEGELVRTVRVRVIYAVMK